MGGAAHARTSDTWKTDKHALGCHGGGRGTTLVRVTQGGKGDISEYIFWIAVDSCSLSKQTAGLTPSSA